MFLALFPFSDSPGYISLYPNSAVVNLYDDNITEIYNSGTMWLLQFYNHWCGHCQRWDSTTLSSVSSDVTALPGLLPSGETLPEMWRTGHHMSELEQSIVLINHVTDIRLGQENILTWWNDDGIYLNHSRSKEHQQQGYFIPTLRSTRWTQHTMVLIFLWRMIRNTISSTSSTISELWSLTEAPSLSSWDMRGKYWNFSSLNQELFQLSQPGARKKQRRTSEDVWIGIRESEIHCSPVWGGWSQCWKESGAGYEQLQWHHHHKKVCLHFSEYSWNVLV